MAAPTQKNSPKWINGETGQETETGVVFGFSARQSVLLLGESHTREDHHKWQLMVLTELLKLRDKIAIGFEMFPQRVQSILDLWIAGDLSEKQFLHKTEWDKVWGFDPDLYIPLFQFCKKHGLQMIALNCERQLVRDIGKSGWEEVDNKRLESITTAKPATSEYRQYLFDVTGGARPDRATTNAEDPAFDRFVRAQQVWDRSFACRLAAFYENSPETLLIGIMGSGHLDYRYGTPFQLEDLGVSNVAILLPSNDPAPPEGIADYIYTLPSSETDSL